MLKKNTLDVILVHKTHVYLNTYFALYAITKIKRVISANASRDDIFLLYYCDVFNMDIFATIFYTSDFQIHGVGVRENGTPCNDFDKPIVDSFRIAESQSIETNNINGNKNDIVKAAQSCKTIKDGSLLLLILP